MCAEILADYAIRSSAHTHTHTHTHTAKPVQHTTRRISVGRDANGDEIGTPPHRNRRKSALRGSRERLPPEGSHPWLRTPPNFATHSDLLKKRYILHTILLFAGPRTPAHGGSLCHAPASPHPPASPLPVLLSPISHRPHTRSFSPSRGCDTSRSPDSAPNVPSKAPAPWALRQSPWS